MTLLSWIERTNGTDPNVGGGGLYGPPFVQDIMGETCHLLWDHCTKRVFQPHIPKPGSDTL